MNSEAEKDKLNEDIEYITFKLANMSIEQLEQLKQLAIKEAETQGQIEFVFQVCDIVKGAMLNME